MRSEQIQILDVFSRLCPSLPVSNFEYAWCRGFGKAMYRLLDLKGVSSIPGTIQVP